MRIVVVGAGLVGTTLAERLCRDGHDVSIVDSEQARLRSLAESLDVEVIHGNGASADVLRQARIDRADVVVATTDSDEANRGRDSAEMLRIAHQQTVAAGYGIINLDCIVFAQRPKLNSHKEAIRRRVAEILSLGPGQVGLKAKTGEGVGSLGHEEVMTAQCVVLLQGVDDVE